MTTTFKDVWFLHWLTASGGLQEFQQRISIEIDQAFQTLKTFTSPPKLDILLGRSAYTIPEIGVLGRAYNSTLLSLNFDPDNTNFKPTLKNDTVQRQLLHEVHHCLRMAGPGYGWTLGEALISEGLAGHFVNNLMNTPPEPWECAITPEVLRTYSPPAAELRSSSYNHASWFFGRAQLPRWLGYSLGFELVRLWREITQPHTHDQWVNTPATEILAFGEQAGLIQA